MWIGPIISIVNIHHPEPLKAVLKGAASSEVIIIIIILFSNSSKITFCVLFI